MLGLWLGLLGMTLLALAVVLWPVWSSVQGSEPLTKRQRGVLAIIALLLLVCAGVWYSYGGSSQGLAKRLALNNSDYADLLSKRDTKQIIARMQSHLATQPDSAEGWFLLGKLYLHQGDLPAAITALAKANQLQPTHVDTQLYYAQALFLSDHSSLSAQANALLTSVLASQPDNPLAINLLALDAYQRGHYQLAINYWERLLPNYSPDSDDGKALLSAIANAQQKLTVGSK